MNGFGSKPEMITGPPLLVLVHGSWLGTWSWDGIASALNSKGIETVAVALTGLERSNAKRSAGAGLRDHVDDVEEVLRGVGNRKVVLVGHSYGAVVASEAAGSQDPRIVLVVALDGPLVDAGKSIFTQWPEIEAALAPSIDPQCQSLLAPPPLELIGMNPRLTERHRLVPMPVQTHTEAAKYSSSALLCDRHFIAFEDFALSGLLSSKAAADGWSVTSMAGGHMALVDQPEAVAAKLVSIMAEAGL